jgi:hypothetical protein
MKAIRSSETSVEVHLAIQRHITEKHSFLYTWYQCSVFSLFCSPTVEFLFPHLNTSLAATRMPRPTLTDIHSAPYNISHGTWRMEFLWKNINYYVGVPGFCLCAQWQLRLLGNWWVVESSVLCTNENSNDTWSLLNFVSPFRPPEINCCFFFSCEVSIRLLRPDACCYSLPTPSPPSLYRNSFSLK